MYFKASFTFSILFFLLSLALISCSTEYAATVKEQRAEFKTYSLSMVPGQVPVPNSIKSLQFYPEGSPSSLPVLELGKPKNLILSFDELTSVSGQFRISFTHHEQNWEESNIPDAWYLDGVNEIVVQGGERNAQNDPGYFHYSFTIPGNRVRFAMSGNYLLHVYDQQSGIELFSLPFIVTEDAGEVSTNVETIYNSGNSGAAVDQLFSEFRSPDFVELPQFDLSFSFAQNHLLSTLKIPSEVSNVVQGVTEFHLSRSQAYEANFDYSRLDLHEFTTQTYQIFDYQPASIPPKVILREDFLNFTATPNIDHDNTFGRPNSGRYARYGEVFFRFNTMGRLLNSDGIFLIGDFNQWTISDRYKLRYNEETELFETSALIKEGIYTYKYVTITNGKIDQFTLSDTITKQTQRYTVFVYFRDNEFQYDRLLKVKDF